MQKSSLVIVCLIAFLIPAGRIFAHCDTVDGPVVSSAREALAKSDVTPVLKWVKKADEGGIRSAFVQALAVRAKGDEAKSLADEYFFETVVRVLRQGEGFPYTGLKPAGEVEPGIAAADAALAEGSADELTKHVSSAVTDGIRGRLAKTLALREHSAESVEAGRQFVAAYVDYIHYVEGLATAAHGSAHHE